MVSVTTKTRGEMDIIGFIRVEHTHDALLVSDMGGTILASQISKVDNKYGDDSLHYTVSTIVKEA